MGGGLEFVEGGRGFINELDECFLICVCRLFVHGL